MVIETEIIKEQCAKIAQAVNKDNDAEHSNYNITEVLEIYSYDRVLYINVTNKEYYVRVKINIDSDELIHATVNADLFLKLITQITTPDVELYTKAQTLVVKANGMYKLPLIFDGDKLLELPEIQINNVTCEMDIPCETLRGILRYNSKELRKKTVAQPVQRMYYVDNEGAITFTSSACVNSFKLDKPIRMLLNSKIVKLFKLFEDEFVSFKLGYDALADGIIQTKVSFIARDVELSAILSCDDTLLNSVPVSSIRGMADKIYPYSVTIFKDELIQAINRLTLFNKEKDDEAIFEFSSNKLTIRNVDDGGCEEISYAGTPLNISSPISTMLSFTDVKLSTESFTDQCIILNFGGPEEKAIIITKDNIKNVIPRIVFGR